jgi:glutamate/tyrosine decarboxylase-like PLP-dependent enzyme
MHTRDSGTQINARRSALDIPPEQFALLGHGLVDHISSFLESLPSRPVTPGESPRDVRTMLGESPLPKCGAPAPELLEQTAKLLFSHSLFNGHPRFMGYITSSAAPISALAELLAASVNPNVGGWALSPVASEIEVQTIRWLAELVGFPPTCGGLLVSGGNMANFTGFLAARRARAGWDVRRAGLRGGPGQLVAYASVETHTWLQKAADLFGLGLDAVRWIAVDSDRRMRIDELERRIAEDRTQGMLPFLIVGAAGTVGVGAVDPLREIARIAGASGLWFHVDGAYGAPAASLPEAPEDLKALSLADSVALDPHKWLYAPLEAGCTLVREPAHLIDAFSYHPEYYNFVPTEDQPGVNFYELGLQNSRGFRALKVWLALRQIGREGYEHLIREDIRLARTLLEEVGNHGELEPYRQNLSIATFRYRPAARQGRGDLDEEYLNALNQEILNRIQVGGEAFISNAVVDGRYYLRACIVNFRTTEADVRAVPGIVVKIGRCVHGEFAGRTPVSPPPH